MPSPSVSKTWISFSSMSFCTSLPYLPFSMLFASCTASSIVYISDCGYIRCISWNILMVSSWNGAVRKLVSSMISRVMFLGLGELVVKLCSTRSLL